LKEEDEDGDGTIDKSYYVVRKFKDHFVPSITLALALDYFNRSFSEIEVVIAITSPFPLRRNGTSSPSPGFLITSR
jgi:hypothetical protein